MELPSKLLEKIAFNTRPEIEEHMLIVMDKSLHEEHLYQPLQTNNKQDKIAITFLSRYNGMFSVTNKNNKFNFISVFEGAEYNIITIPPGGYAIESLNEEIERNNIEEGYITKEDNPFTIKPSFSTLVSIIEIEQGKGWRIGFVQDDSLRDLLVFKPRVIHDEYNISD